MSEKEIDAKLESLYDNDQTKGDRYWGRKFRSTYTNVRKALVLIRDANTPTHEGGSREKKNGKIVVKKGKLVEPAQLSNKEAVEKTKLVLEKALADLE